MPRNVDFLAQEFFQKSRRPYGLQGERVYAPLRPFNSVNNRSKLTVAALQSEIHQLRNEISLLKHELQWREDSIYKAQEHSNALVKELVCLKRYAERTNLFNPRFYLILSSLVQGLLEAVAQDPSQQVSDIIPECLSLIDQCPLVRFRWHK
ncbi:uncharacterized protein LOC128884043 isoform X2 [Hylaeus volcanicus]|uniref:uncharacterized protein LOC128884043 isoform X2 n=1 Tax=Hylaeus volcanicus TaxID=313075 RepID=UPI0023B83751|nr:uncharacterized protein LOC128884043 isoform X2 [Hylaeus volcanicus]